MCFWDSDFPFIKRFDKKIYSEFADSRKEKNVCREIKTEMRIMLYFMHFISSFPCVISAQKSKHKSHKRTTQNIWARGYKTFSCSTHLTTKF